MVLEKVIVIMIGFVKDVIEEKKVVDSIITGKWIEVVRPDVTNTLKLINKIAC